MDIIFASHNLHKLEEIKDLLKNIDINIVSLNDLNETIEVYENGCSFTENAKIKAQYFYQKYNKPVLADDSGLVIPAFDNKPGIYSARYAGVNANSLENNIKLLSDISNLKDRRAYFICKVCYINGNGTYFFTGKLYGTIAFNIEGQEGFGYDPIFILDNGKRLSEISLQDKNKISHRAIALRKWIEFIMERGKN